MIRQDSHKKLKRQRTLKATDQFCTCSCIVCTTFAIFCKTRDNYFTHVFHCCIHTLILHTHKLISTVSLTFTHIHLHWRNGIRYKIKSLVVFKILVLIILKSTAVWSKDDPYTYTYSYLYSVLCSSPLVSLFLTLLFSFER